MIDRIFYRVEVGSTAHGFGITGQEDIDHMAIALPELNEWCKVDSSPQDSYVYRPGRGPSDPSGPGDLDLVVYGALKYCKLAYKGNPSILAALYSPIIETSELGNQLRALGESGCFVSYHAKNAFCGYLEQQRRKLFKSPASRQHLVDKYGYDTKYVTHMARLAIQGYEFLTTGRINIPMEQPYLDDLITMRSGGLSMDDALAYVHIMEKRLLELDINKEPDSLAINNYLHNVYETITT
jgi:predicted nucleotidyltransferase